MGVMRGCSWLDTLVLLVVFYWLFELISWCFCLLLTCCV